MGQSARTSRVGACLSWSYPVPRSSWRRRSGYWVHRSPLGVLAPSGSFVILSPSGIFRNRATTSSNLGSSSEALPGTADLALALTSQVLEGSSHGLLCPFSVRGEWSRTRGRTFQVQRHPLSAFLTPSGVLSSTRPATICRWLTLFGFYPSEPSSSRTLAVSSSLVLPSSMFLCGRRFGRLPDVAHVRSCIPGGFRCPRSGSDVANR